MSRSLNILMLSKDPALFFSEETAFNDSCERHVIYATALRCRYPGSEIRIITNVPRFKSKESEQSCDGLRIYSTDSIHRVTYLLGVLKRLPMVLDDGWRPDVVTVQTPWEEGSLGYLLARILKAKYVPQLHFDLFSKEWKKEHWLNPWRKQVASWLLRRGDTIRVVSNVQREKLIEGLGVTHEKIHVVPVGVNFQPVTGMKSNFKRNIAPTLENKKIVLFVGRFCAQKNLSLWVDVAEAVSRQMYDVVFVMAGNGPMFDKVRLFVKQKKIEERFYFLGHVEHKSLPQVYAAADVFLLTSDYEGLPRVILESYLSGIPVVSTDVGGVRDLVDTGSTGFLLSCGDSQGLADAVMRLLEDDRIRERFGNAGHKKIVTQFPFTELTEKLIDCWTNA